MEEYVDEAQLFHKEIVEPLFCLADESVFLKFIS
jgi:hypothetical protein